MGLLLLLLPPLTAAAAAAAAAAAGWRGSGGAPLALWSADCLKLRGLSLNRCPQLTFPVALEEAKEAGRQERNLAKKRTEMKTEPGTQLDLGFAVYFNLALCYHLCRDYQHALTAYQRLIKTCEPIQVCVSNRTAGIWPGRSASAPRTREMLDGWLRCACFVLDAV